MLARTLDEATTALDHRAPLEYGDPRWVDLGPARSDDARTAMVIKLQRKTPGRFCHLALVSHRGTGKSTELLNLQNPLGDRRSILYFAANTEMDPAAIAGEDLLLVMARHVERWMRLHGMPLDDGVMARFADWLAQVTQGESWHEHVKAAIHGEVGADVSPLSRMLAGLEALFRAESETRNTVVSKLRQFPGALLGSVNELLDDANKKLASAGRGELLILIDNLDRYHPHVIDDLLLKSGDQIAQLRCDLIVTPPISLQYRPETAPLSKYLDVEVMHTPRLRRPDQPYDAFDGPGRDLLEQALARRIDLDALLPDRAARDRLISVTGGSIRELIRLARDASLQQDQGPLVLASIERVCSRVRAELRDQVLLEGWQEPLAEIARTKQLTAHESSLDLLHHRLVLAYSGGEPWYDVHPLVAEIPEIRDRLEASESAAAARVQVSRGDRRTTNATPSPVLHDGPSIERVDHLRIENVGPAAVFDLWFKPRVNLLTGDNSLGKTFVLDVIWWALTGTWPEHPAWPQANPATAVSSGNGAGSPLASAAATIQLGDSATTARSTFDVGRGHWMTPGDWPQMRGLVIYARVDGGFSVWDPASLSSDSPEHSPGLHFTPDEVFHGKTAGEGWKAKKVCQGLIESWLYWETRDPPLFQRFVAALDALGDPPVFEPGVARKVGDDDQPIPHIRFLYGEFPIILASAAVKRILRLAYLLVWTWNRHREFSARLSRSPARHMVVLIDEVESHLHPTWQRVLLPALLEVIGKLDEPLDAAPPAESAASSEQTSDPGTISVQLIASTHAPLVTASLEPLFDEDVDQLFHFTAQARDVTVEELPWSRHGDVSGWLTSEVFGLSEPYSRPAEKAIHRAMALYRQAQPDRAEIEEVDRELCQVLGGLDPFWVRWRAFLEAHAVSR